MSSSCSNNNNLNKLRKQSVEGFRLVDQAKLLSHYRILDNLADVASCTKPHPYRSKYDQYWNLFYCKKSMNTNTDLMSLVFT